MSYEANHSNGAQFFYAISNSEKRRNSKDEIVRLKEIDRSEIVEKLYHLQDGKLVLKDEFYDIKNEWWVKTEVEKNIFPRLYDLFERGGTVYGAFDDLKIAGMAALESRFIGKDKDQLQLYILFVSKDYRTERKESGKS